MLWSTNGVALPSKSTGGTVGAGVPHTLYCLDNYLVRSHANSVQVRAGTRCLHFVRHGRGACARAAFEASYIP
jgi:hypothetical protein